MVTLVRKYLPAYYSSLPDLDMPGISIVSSQWRACMQLQKTGLSIDWFPVLLRSPGVTASKLSPEEECAQL
jgi:hypothetical protein